MEINLDRINSIIYIIRDQKVMLDSDLARLYGVETKRLNEQVKRNIKHFPDDFIIECNSDSLKDLLSQIATTGILTNCNYKVERCRCCVLKMVWLSYQVF